MRGRLQEAAQGVAESQHPREDRTHARTQHQPHDHRMAAFIVPRQLSTSPEFKT